MLHITEHSKDAKLEGFESISTSVLLNPICQARAQTDSICAKCYAERLTAYRKGLRDNLAENYILLQNPITEDALNECVFHTLYARIESFGDVASVTQAENYIRIIMQNPDTNFGIWSKNLDLWVRAFDHLGKPRNCTFVLSSPKIDEPVAIRKIDPHALHYIDHIFTVWNPENYPVNEITGHCAGVKCRTCLKCYKHGTPFYINEALRLPTKKNKEARKRLEEIIAALMRQRETEAA